MGMLDPCCTRATRRARDAIQALSQVSVCVRGVRALYTEAGSSLVCFSAVDAIAVLVTPAQRLPSPLSLLVCACGVISL